MPGNTYLIADQSKLLRLKLEALSKTLREASASKTLVSQEAYLLEATKLINEFYKSISAPLLQVDTVHADDYPNPDIFNILWQQLLDDLIIIFQELENIESFTINNFNFVNAEAGRLVAHLKSVSSKLGEYILYAVDHSKDAIYFRDSFNNLAKIDFNSPLLNAEQCEINQAEGIVTLPIDGTQDALVPILEPPTINAGSNGVVGNNEEIGVAWNGSLISVYDGNPDTWFEYERVISLTSQDRTPLVLDFTINLGSLKIINNIRINPHNFGVKTAIEVVEIETSINGQDYVSIKDDIPITGYTTQDEANVFMLAPSTSKYAGQGHYTFTPRQTKYIHFILRQSEPYLIETSGPDKLRYAIGIREIELRSLAFKPTGEFISLGHQALDEIRKLILQTNQTPVAASDLANIRYHISPDNGVTWQELIPENIGQGQNWMGTQTESGVAVQTTREVLNFNGTDQDSITTSAPVYSLRLKGTLTRNDAAFKAGASLHQKKLTTSEAHTVPTCQPYELILEIIPLRDSLSVIDPLFGSRGIPESPLYVGFQSMAVGHGQFRLPFTRLPRPLTKIASGNAFYLAPASASEWLHVSVGGEEWTQATGPFTDYGSQVTLENGLQITVSADKVFNFDPNTGILTFGNDEHGSRPGADTLISVYFDAERLFPSEDEAHRVLLEFPTNTAQSALSIERYDKLQTANELLPRGATEIHLKHGNITDYTDIIAVFGSGNEKIFLNGKEELSASGHWSLDTEHGILYLYSPTDSFWDISVAYQYQPIVTLGDQDWAWTSTGGLSHQLQIKPSGWTTSDFDSNVSLLANGMVLDLPNLALVKGSLSISCTGFSTATENPFIKEVPYVDGIQELGAPVIQKVENLSLLASSSVQTFSLTETPITTLGYLIVFSNQTLFATSGRKSTAAEVQSHGQWHVSTTGVVTYFLNTGTDLTAQGSISYYYTMTSTRDDGIYSVDYRTGRVFTQRTMDTDWIYHAKYKYTDYRAKYHIAREVPVQDLSVDYLKGKIRLGSNDLMRRASLPKKRVDGAPQQYLVNYSYMGTSQEDIQALKNYFSPILRDYTLKVITKGKIF